MDKTKHPDWLIVLTYAVMAFSRAGKDLLDFPDMLICGLSGIIMGIFIVAVEKFNLPSYICRATGAFAAALFIIEVCAYTKWSRSDTMAIVAAMVPPVAAGAMFIEGLCTGKEREGQLKTVNAIVISAFLALAVCRAVSMAKWRGVQVIGPLMR